MNNWITQKRDMHRKTNDTTDWIQLIHGDWREERTVVNLICTANVEISSFWERQPSLKILLLLLLSLWEIIYGTPDFSNFFKNTQTFFLCRIPPKVYKVFQLSAVLTLLKKLTKYWLNDNFTMNITWLFSPNKWPQKEKEKIRWLICLQYRY